MARGKIKYKKRNLNVLTVNTFTLVLGIVFLIVGSIFQQKDFFNGIFVNEIFIFLIPAFFLAGTGKRNYVLSIKKLRIIDVIRVILVTILSYPIILLINGIFLFFLSNAIELKNFSMNTLLLDQPVGRYLFFLCLVPSICEEIFFRGALINSYNIYGRKFAIAMSAFIFALFHFDIQNFVSIFMLGILFANLLDLTGSIFGAMLGHFTNNVIAFLSAKYFNDMIFSYLKTTDMAQDIGSLQVYIIIVLSLASIVCMYLLRKLFVRMNKEKFERLEKSNIKNRTREMQSIDIFNFVPILSLIILYFIYYGVVF